MSIALVSSTIRDYFNSNYSLSPIAYENVTFDTTIQEWVKLNILFGESEQISIGVNPCYRIKGIVDIQVFETKGTGLSKTETIIDTVISLFSYKRLNGIRFYQPVINKSGIVKNFNSSNISFNFDYQVSK